MTGLWAVKPTNCSISGRGERFSLSTQSVSTEVLSPGKLATHLYLVKGKGHPVILLGRHVGVGGDIAPTHSQPGNGRRWVVNNTLRPL